jgi:hypothetical protein
MAAIVVSVDDDCRAIEAQRCYLPLIVMSFPAAGGDRRRVGGTSFCACSWLYAARS